MGTLRYIPVFVIILFLGTSDAQDEVTIAWTPDYRLTWADFRGKVPSNPRAAATTASGISYQFSAVGNGREIKLDFTVNTFFYPDKSWYRPELCDSLILSHERLHFDISELYARKMRERLAATRFTRNVKAEVRAIYREILKELSDFQNLYDDRTNFSRDTEQQLIWNKKIEEALKQ